MTPADFMPQFQRPIAPQAEIQRKLDALLGGMMGNK